jgi:hypothetical protein
LGDCGDLFAGSYPLRVHLNLMVLQAKLTITSTSHSR